MYHGILFDRRLLKILKQLSYVLTGIKRAIPRKLVKIIDCCRVSRQFLIKKLMSNFRPEACINSHDAHRAYRP